MRGSQVLIVTLPTSVFQLVPAQVGRKQVTIRNQGATDLYWSYRADVSTSNGMKLDADGLLQLNQIDGDNTEAEIYAIAETAPVSVAVLY